MANIKISDLPLIANIPPTSGEFPIVYNNVTYKMNWSQLNNQITASGANPLNVTGTGTTNSVPKWTTGGSVLGDSLIEDNGSIVTINGNIKIPNSGTIGSAGTSNAITILSGGQVGINGTPINDFHVFGSVMSIQGPTASLRLRGTGINMLIDLSSKNGYFEIRDVNNGKNVYQADPGVNGYQRWYINGVQKMMLDSNGNVGIGGTPSYPLHVSGNIIAVEDSAPALRLIGGTTTFDLKSDSGIFLVKDVSSGSELYHIAAGGSGYHKWYINDVQKMMLDSNGNVGIGITPENSTGTWRNLQFGGGNIVFRSSGNNGAFFGTNYLFKTNNSEVYKDSAATSRMYFADDVIKIQQAGIGTAGNSVVWTTPLTISSGGNVGIGTTTPSFATIDSLTQRGIEISGTKESGTAPVIRLSETGSGKGFQEIRSQRAGSGNYLAFGEAADTFMVIRSDDDGGGVTTRGNVGIGTTSPGNKLHIEGSGLANESVLRVNNQAQASSRIWLRNSGQSGYIFNSGTAAETLATGILSQAMGFGINNNSPIQFYNGSTASVKLTISSGGNVGIGTTSPNYALEVMKAVSGDWIAKFTNSHVGNAHGMLLDAGVGNTSYELLRCRTHGGGSNLFKIIGNGNAQNLNNSYGGFSDIKLKENITDASPKLEDLMQVKIRNYNLIGYKNKQIGVIAQELEEIFPSMIEESPDREDREVTDEEGNVTTEIVDLGTVTKSVKYSVFTPILIKAIQEQQTIINTLIARIDTLENN